MGHFGDLLRASGESDLTPGRSGCVEDFVDVHDFELLLEFVSVDPITISQEIPRRTVKREGFQDLPCSPLRSRIGGHIDVEDAASVVSEHDENIQDVE